MSQWLRKIGCFALVLSMGCAFVACSEDKDDDPEQPPILDEVSVLWENMGGDSAFKGDASPSCDSIVTAVDNFSNNREKSLIDACAKYQTEAARGVSKLVSDGDYSGFYLAAFILANRMDKASKTCVKGTNDSVSTSKKYHDLFERKGNCTSFLSDAETIVSKRK